MPLAEFAPQPGHGVTAALRIAVTLALALAGAAVAVALDVPLPWLLGPLFTVATAAVFGVRVRGQALAIPHNARTVMVPVIGVAVGTTVGPDIAHQVARWWPSLISVVPFVLVVQLANYALFRRLAGYDRPTAFFAASPGGLVEAVLTGEQRGGSVATMATQHFARIALAVAIVPVAVTQLAGPAAGLMPPSGGASGALTAMGAAWLIGSGVVGAAGARRLGLPAALIVGPFVLSALLQGTGVTADEVPAPLVHAAQLVVGTTLGQRFAGLGRRQIVAGFGLALIAVLLALGVAAGLALALAPVVGVPAAAVFLAFSPGGVAEMSLVAVSLGADPAFVAMHHLLRILVAVTLPPMIFDRLVARRAEAARNRREG